MTEITKRQLWKISSLIKGWTQDQINELLKPYGKLNIYELTRQEASEIIDKLTKKQEESAGKLIIEESQPCKVEVIKYEKGGFGFKIAARGAELEEILKAVLEAVKRCMEELEDMRRVVREETVQE